MKASVPLAGALLGGLLSAAPPPEPAVAFLDVNVVPMDGRRVLLDQTVLVVGQRIVAVGPDVVVPEDALRIHADGRWLAPGLIDAHVHLFDEHDLPAFLAAGVTTAVEMSGSPTHIEWRTAVASGALVGPTLHVAGPMIDEVTDPLFGLMEAVGSEEDAAQVVGEHARAGYDFVKVHGDVEVGLYDAVVDQAATFGLPVVGHLSERVGLLHAMKRRQATVEHADEYVQAFFNGRLDRARIPVAVRATLRGGARVTPTLVSVDALSRMLTDEVDVLTRAHADEPALPLATWGRHANPYRKALGPEAAAGYRQSLAFQVELVAALHAAGVPIQAGTDAGWVPFVAYGRSLQRELELLDLAGLDPYEALHAATATPGDFLGGDAGRVVAGKRADLVLLDANPLVDPATWKAPQGVMAHGRWHDRADLADLRATRKQRGERWAGVAEAVARADAKEAVTEAAALVRSGDGDEAGLRVLAIHLAQVGEGARAVEVLAMNGEAHPRSWQAMQLAGRAALLQGEPEIGVVRLERALEEAPEGAASAQISRELELAQAAKAAGSEG